MANWLPVLKAVLPYAAQIVAATAPVFTARKTLDKVDPAVIVEQIDELQEAVKTNAQSLKVLAEQIHMTVQAMTEAAAANDRMMKAMQMVTGLSLILALLAVAVAVFAVWGR